MRRPAAKNKPRVAQLKSFPAPVHGWIANVNLATPAAKWKDGSTLRGAFTLENWFPTATGLRMRAGSARHANVSGGDIPVTSIFSYVNGPNSSLFAATENSIYDITTSVLGSGIFLVDEDGNFLVNASGEYLVTASPSEASVESLTGGNWSVCQFATDAGVFLRAVNGSDEPLVYDGSAWGTTPAITGDGDPEDFSNVWAFKNRLFFIAKDTLDAYYLPVDVIGGDAVLLPLGAVFSLGGSLMFGHAWSLDTGSGLNEQCVFITTEGEVAVFQGSDPNTADTWTKVGVYRIGRPRGPKAFIRAGGDLIIATDIGFVALSQAINRDVAALSPVAVSYPIQDAWNLTAAERPAADWECAIWPTKETVAVSYPAGGGQQKSMFIANANTGAWTKYGWGATCVHVYDERFFFGTSDGYVIEGEITGADNGLPYTATCVPMFDPLKSPASLKSGVQARLVYRASAAVTAQLSLQKDFMVRLPAAPDDTRIASTNVWGAARWGSGTWGSGSAEKLTFQPWRSVPGSGYSLSPASQVTSGSVETPDIEMVQTDLTFELGDIGT